jgi:hypothetical protein
MGPLRRALFFIVTLSRRLLDRIAALSPAADRAALAAAVDLTAVGGAFAELQVHSERGPAAIAGFPAIAGASPLASAAARFGADAGDQARALCEIVAAVATDWGGKITLDGAAPFRFYARGPFSPADLEAVGTALGTPIDTSGLEEWARVLSFAQIQMLGARLDPRRPEVVAYLSAANTVAGRGELERQLGRLVASELAGSRWPRAFGSLGAELLTRPRDEHIHISLSPSSRGWIKIDLGPRTAERGAALATAAAAAKLPPLAAALERLEGTRASHFGLRMGPGEACAVSIYRRVL